MVFLTRTLIALVYHWQRRVAGWRGVIVSTMTLGCLGWLVTVAGSVAIAAPVVSTTSTAPTAPLTSSSSVPTELRIGYANTMDPSVYIDIISPLVDALKSHFPHTTIRTSELSLDDMDEQSLTRMDFLLLSGAEARMLGEVTPFPVATWRSGESHEINRSVGSVFVVKADSPIHTLAQMRGRRVVANDEHSFEGWLIAMDALVEVGYHWEDFFGAKTFTHWQYPDVITLLEADLADVGVLPTCALERAMAQGALLPGSLRVVADKTEKGRDVCQRSTELFPGMQLVAMPQVSPEVVKTVMLAAFSLPAQADGGVWLPNNDTSRVDQLLENLRIGPYAYLKTFSLRALWERYRVWILLALAAVALLLIDVVRVNRIVKRRTAELEAESQARHAAAQALEASQHRLDLLERASVVSQLSAMIAHDIKQPLTVLVNYLNGLALLLKQGRVDVPLFTRTIDRVVGEAYRVSDIIERVRQVNRREWAQKSAIDLVAVVQRVLDYAKLPPEAVTLPEKAMILGNALEIELVVINLVRNARAAAKSPGGTGEVTLTLALEATQAVLTVNDTGPRVSDEVFASLGQVTRSSKPDGMGYGLAIATSIAEAHAGHLTFARREPQGLSVQLVLPLFHETLNKAEGQGAAASSFPPSGDTQ